MEKTQNNVASFMRKAGQKVFNKPINPDSITSQDAVLRVKLILEEALEFAEAMGIEILLNGESLDIESINLNELRFYHNGAPNLVEAADAIADLNYVSYGVANTLGIDMEEIENHVHESNMSKFIDGFRGADGKWIKGPSYTPVDIEPIINKQKGDD